MATLEQIRSSNSNIATALPPGLVAVFAGATNGIGETSLKQFAKRAVKPRIYFLGRSKESGNRVRAELQKLNPEGEYNFISVDVSLLRSVDEVCREIKSKESAINLLFLSTGSIVTGKGERTKDKPVAVWEEADSFVTDTEEGLHYPVAVGYYARLRFIVNLLPLLQNATGLRRVVTVLAGTKEGAVNPNDFQMRRETSLFSPSGRGHITSMTTLALEAIAQTAPTVSFVHDYPGAVKSNLGNDVEGIGFALFRLIFKAVFFVLGPLFAIPVDEAGERHLFFSTSARFSARDEGGATGVPLPKGVTVARGTDGKSGSGVYSIDQHAEIAPPKVEQLLEKLREDGTAKKVWSDVEAEFIRITGTPSI
jgi:NAD(P)-dependent dehydrogenase (short-subunit alcohol dehydrogenase family)